MNTRDRGLIKDTWGRAQIAGEMAADNHKPTPMVVTSDGGAHVETVRDGVCGFAWIEVKPRNCAVARWLKEKPSGVSGSVYNDNYRKCIAVWISDYNQSMELKSAHARAMADRLQELVRAGLAKSITAHRRID